MLGLIIYHISLSGPTEGRERDSLMNYQFARFNIVLYHLALQGFDSLMESDNRVGALCRPFSPLWLTKRGGSPSLIRNVTTPTNTHDTLTLINQKTNFPSPGFIPLSSNVEKIKQS